MQLAISLARSFVPFNTLPPLCSASTGSARLPESASFALVTGFRKFL